MATAMLGQRSDCRHDCLKCCGPLTRRDLQITRCSEPVELPVEKLIWLKVQSQAAPMRVLFIPTTKWSKEGGAP